MPNTKGKGGKSRRRGRNDNTGEKRELRTKEAFEQYAQVVRMLGNGRLEAYCVDGRHRLCHIRGKMRKKIWINNGDFVLVSLRDFQDDKGDVVFKYTPDEARNLKAMKEIPETFKIPEAGGIENIDEDIEFDEPDDAIDISAL